MAYYKYIGLLFTTDLFGLFGRCLHKSKVNLGAVVPLSLPEKLSIVHPHMEVTTVLENGKNYIRK